jgi:hypothetical protein
VWYNYRQKYPRVGSIPLSLDEPCSEKVFLQS